MRPVGAILGRPWLLVGLGAILAVVAFQLWITPSNPPGFHRDEAALSLNAYTLSTGLRDEDGARLPLFFRSFDDYKSPLYPYLLAGVFRITGPDAQVARGLSAVLVIAAILLLGWLAWRLTGSTVVAVDDRRPCRADALALRAWSGGHRSLDSAPASRPAARRPRADLAARPVSGRRRHRRRRAARISHVRVHGEPPARAPFRGCAGGLRWPGSLALRRLRPGVHSPWLSSRWVSTRSGIPVRSRPDTRRRRSRATACRASGSYDRLSATGSGTSTRGTGPLPGIRRRTSTTAATARVFLAVVALALASVVLVLRRKREDRWWRFVLLATLLAPIPAALTVDRFNAIRLVALPVLLLVLAIPALDAVVSAARMSWPARVVVVLFAVSVGVQFAQFLHEYRTRGPARLVLFEAGVAPLLEEPLASGETIYLDYDDRGAHAQARWYAAEAGLPSRSGRRPSGRWHPTRWLARVPGLSGLRLPLRGYSALGGLPARARDHGVAGNARLTTSSRAGCRSASSRPGRSSGRGSPRTSGSSGARRPPTTPSAPSRSRA